MKYIGYILFLMVAVRVAGQDRSVLYSQYLYNKLAINPSYAGCNEVFTVSIATRNQWIGQEGAPKTQTLSSHIPMKNTNLALGLLLAHESIGARDYTSAFLYYAYRVRLSTGKLSLGLRAGVLSGKMNLDGIDEDPVYYDREPKYMLPNFGIGGYYYNDRMFIGLSVPLLLGYEDGSDANRLKPYHSFKSYSYYVISGYSFRIDSRWEVQPSLLLNYAIAPGYNIDINCNVSYMNVIKGGITYRTNRTLILLLDYKFNYRFRGGLAYDYGFGAINRYNHSAFELFLQYEFRYKVQVPSLRDF
jgi:type IX secretion system PorP/SprF family membrane protein